MVPDAPPSKGSAAEDDPNRAFFLGVKGNAQMLGIRGAAVETDIWKIRLQLTKPVTWIPLIWGETCLVSCCPLNLASGKRQAVLPSLRMPAILPRMIPSTQPHDSAGVICGAAASGNFEWTFRDCALSALCMLMSGPLLTGFTQTMNDYYDREMDAINEPNRPIPSGMVPEPGGTVPKDPNAVLLSFSWVGLEGVVMRSSGQANSSTRNLLRTQQAPSLRGMLSRRSGSSSSPALQWHIRWIRHHVSVMWSSCLDVGALNVLDRMQVRECSVQFCLPVPRARQCR